jgi:hypothetical protein
MNPKRKERNASKGVKETQQRFRDDESNAAESMNPPNGAKA